MTIRDTLDTDKRMLVYYYGGLVTDKHKIVYDEGEEISGIHLLGVANFVAVAENRYGNKVNCTFRREPIKNRNTYYWYAYKRYNKKLYKKYIGTDDKLTFETIRATIADLCNTNI